MAKENKVDNEKDILADAQLGLSMLELEYLEERYKQLSKQEDYDVLHGKVTCEFESCALHVQLKTLKDYISVLKNRILIEKARMLDRNKPVIVVNEQLLDTDLVKKMAKAWERLAEVNKPEPWEEDNATRTVETPCGPVRVVNTDKTSKEELDGMIHHCGQDADEHQPAGYYAYEGLLGMELMFVFPHGHKCADCLFRKGADGSECSCVKVELVGGDYICLAKPQQDDRPVISFDEEEQQQEETTHTIMDGIREQTKTFMDYLDSVVKD